MTAPALRCVGLTALHAPDAGVEDLDLEVRVGEVFGFLGPNGAGKTTTIRLLLDLLRPDRGSAEVLGVETRAGGPELRRRIGFLPGDLALFPRTTGRRTLELFAALQRAAPVRREATLDRLGFPRDALDRAVRTYSTGMRQMIGLTIAFQHDPELLVLDEPTTGLDPMVRDGFLDLVREARARGRTVFLSSHVLTEVERVADRVALIARSRLRLTATLDELRARRPRTVTVIRRDGTRETWEHAGDPDPLLRRLAEERPLDVLIEPATLDAVFRAAVSEAGP
ncbi:MAG TPA: ABC transporter ATP-binding protein [Planctomycetota bacterium]|nr:ABC transporter ATP-binding protein [Planctomycetota bacterium]